MDQLLGLLNDIGPSLLYDAVYPLSMLALAGVALVVGYNCIFWSSHAVDLDGKQLPGPPAKFFMGNWSDIKALKQNSDGSFTERISEKMAEVYANHGSGGISVMRVFSLMVVQCADRAAVKDVLTGGYAKFPKALMYKNLEYGLGKGLVTANGEPWRAHRRIVEKAFHRSALNAMLPKFARHTAEMLDNWEARLATTKQQGAGADLTTDAFVEMTHLTLDIICDTGFGFQLHSKRKGGEASDVTCAISALLMEINTRFKQMSPISNYTSCSRMREARNAWRVVNGLLTEHIESQRAQKHSSSIGGSGKEKREPKDMSLLDHLLHAELEEGEKRLTSQELRDEVVTFLGAGHETTANMLTWTLLELAKPCNRASLQRLQAEIDTQAGAILREDEGGTLSYANFHELLAKCTYLDAVCNESLRRHVVIPSFGRMAAEEVTVAGRRFKKGTHFILNVKALAHNSDVWPEPLTFRPERFVSTTSTSTSTTSSSNVEAKGTMADDHHHQQQQQGEISGEAAAAAMMKPLLNPTAFDSVPFSAGARSCIGKRFSLLEAKTILVLILLRFEPHGPSAKADESVEAVTCRPKHGMPLLFRLRYASPSLSLSVSDRGRIIVRTRSTHT